MKTILDLKNGELATVSDFASPSIKTKLMEMGCLPGEKIILVRKAPLGCPVAIRTGNTELSIRREEAMEVLVQSDI